MNSWRIRSDDWSAAEIQNGSSELKHYGIQGMKWGVRRTPEQLGHKTQSSSTTSKSAKSVSSLPSGSKSSSKTARSVSSLSNKSSSSTSRSSSGSSSRSSGVTKTRTPSTSTIGRALNVETVTTIGFDGAMSYDEFMELLEEQEEEGGSTIDKLKKKLKKTVETGKEKASEALKKIGDAVVEAGKRVSNAISTTVEKGKNFLAKLFNVQEGTSFTINYKDKTITGTGNYSLSKAQKAVGGDLSDWTLKKK